MRTLIVFASKNGAAKECARYIEKGLTEESTVINLTREIPTVLSAYDKIVIGSSVYAGNLRPELKQFYEKNAGELKDKRIFLFLSCLDGSKKEEYIKKGIPSELADKIEVSVSCGGILDMNKLNFFERAIMKKILKDYKDQEGKAVVLKKDTVLNELDYDAMKEFIEILNKKQ